MPVLLTTAYFPPVEYLACMAKEFTLSPDRVNPSVAYIEAHENYQKQSWRNRCMIAAADGPCMLNYPIVHCGDGRKVPIGDLRIDWGTPWLVQHQRAIDAAYHSSAYFDYYRDDLFALMDSLAESGAGMLEFNTSLLSFLLAKTGVACEIRFTSAYGVCDAPSGTLGCTLGGTLDCTLGGDNNGELCEDLRAAIHPKRPNTILRDLGLERPYYQVFQQRNGFLRGMSAIDLLFNEGPDSIVFLAQVRQ